MESSKFKCPKCGSPTRVIDSRSKTPSSTRRRRLCLNPECKYRVTTIEKIFIKEKFKTPTIKEKFKTPTIESKRTLPLYLFSTPLRENSLKVIEAESRQKATEIALEKGWADGLDWRLTYLGWPVRK